MNTIVIDSTNCRSDLCDLCAKWGTDKSPYCIGGHRHPYTAPYSLFLEPLRNKPIKFAEFGVYRGASLIAWRFFFSRARLFGFDWDQPNLEHIKTINLPGVFLDYCDASKPDTLEACFLKHIQDGELFDVIIDDASHDPADQCLMIRTALSKLKQGGLLIIEDIFRDRTEQPFLDALEEMKSLISFKTFIMCEHADRFSPGWNNDKMLVIVRG
jgi:hypothetical protein